MSLASFVLSFLVSQSAFAQEYKATVMVVLPDNTAIQHFFSVNSEPQPFTVSKDYACETVFKKEASGHVGVSVHCMAANDPEGKHITAVTVLCKGPNSHAAFGLIDSVANTTTTFGLGCFSL